MRARDGARRLIADVGNLRHPLTQPVDARGRVPAEVHPSEREAAQVREVGDAAPRGAERREPAHQVEPGEDRDQPLHLERDREGKQHQLFVGPAHRVREHDAEHRCRRAEQQPVARQHHVEEPAAEPAPEIVPEEAARAPCALQPAAEEPEHVHVHRHVHEAGVHEHVRREGPWLLGEVAHLEPERARHVHRTHDRELQEVDRHVDGDQPLHRRRDPRLVLVVVCGGERHGGPTGTKCINARPERAAGHPCNNTRPGRRFPESDDGSGRSPCPHRRGHSHHQPDVGVDHHGLLEQHRISTVEGRALAVLRRMHNKLRAGAGLVCLLDEP